MSAVTPPAALASVFHPGFGEKLRNTRIALGLTPADVAAKLKLGARQIESLEAEDFAQLPGEVFTRGFVRNYARLLELDPEQLIVPVDIHAVVSETVTAPSEGVIFASPGLRRWVLLPMLALAIFVVLVAVLYYWLRQGEDTLVGDTPTAGPAAAVALGPAPVLPQPPAAVAPAHAVAPADVAPVLPGSAPPPSAMPTVAPALAATPVQPPAAPSAAAKPAAVAPAPAPVPVPAAVATLKTHTLRFAPALDAWIQVVDGKGKRYSKLVRSGDVEAFAGEAPFKLVVGEAAQVQLSYDGHPIDLTPYIGQKVARLTLE